MQYKRIVLNEPHASIEGLYDNQLSFWNIDDRFINDIVLKWTDWHTDYLFHGVDDNSIRTVRFPYSRFIVDFGTTLWKSKDRVFYTGRLKIIPVPFHQITKNFSWACGKAIKKGCVRTFVPTPSCLTAILSRAT